MGCGHTLLPGKGKTMIYSVNEPVKVLVLFEGRGVKPVRFFWRGVSYSIKEVTFKWRDREGGGLIHHFAVSDGSNAFQLAYHSEHLTWKLEAVDLEG
jgi:hypothetical protein